LIIRAQSSSRKLSGSLLAFMLAILAAGCGGGGESTGAQSATGLEDLLRDAEITDVVVVGLATDYCVKETALDAARLGFTTTVLADGVRSVNLNPGDGARAIAEMVGSGVTGE